MRNVRQDATASAKLPKRKGRKYISSEQKYLSLALKLEESSDDPETVYRNVGLMFSPTFLEIVKEAGFDKEAIDALANCLALGEKASFEDTNAVFRLCQFASRLYYAGWVEAMNSMSERWS